MNLTSCNHPPVDNFCRVLGKKPPSPPKKIKDVLNPEIYVEDYKFEDFYVTLSKKYKELCL